MRSQCRTFEEAALASWGIALFEYLLQVPANRIGYTALSLSQLKIIQEVISLSVFIPFAVLYMDQPFKWDYVWAALCMLGAVRLTRSRCSSRKAWRFRIFRWPSGSRRWRASAVWELNCPTAPEFCAAVDRRVGRRRALFLLRFFALARIIGGVRRRRLAALPRQRR